MIDLTCDNDIFYHQTQEKLNKILPSDSSMFHYTSVDVLQKIISNGYMFATHINFMNDWEEYILGYKELTKAIKNAVRTNSASMEILKEEDKEYLLSILSDECLNVTNYFEINKIKGFMEYREFLLPEVYSISFCSSRDSLNQWSMYAKESGVAIEFDFSDFVLCDASLKEHDVYREEDWQQIKYYRYNKPHKIYYDDKELKSKMNEQVNEVIRELANPDFMKKFPTIRPTSYLLQEIIKLYAIVPFFKFEKFKGEEETRLAFMRLNKVIYNKKSKKHEEFLTQVFYRDVKHVLKPYIKIGWEPKEEKYKKSYPIKRIIVGPGSNQEAVFRGIIHFVENQSDKIIPCSDSRLKFKNPFVGDIYKTGNGIYIQKSEIPFIF